MECSKDKLYFLIESCRRNDMNASEVHHFISAAWPNECPSLVHTRRIMREFRDGTRETFSRQEGCGRKKSEARIENVNTVRRLIEEDGRFTIDNIADILQISHAMVQRIMHEDLEVIWYRNKWVPHVLTDFNKAVRVDRCNELIATMQSRLCKSNMVSVDEKWFYCRKLKPSNRIGTWLTEEGAAGGDSPAQTARRSTMESKFMAVIAVSQRGHHYFEILNRNESMNAERYVEFLTNMIQFFSTIPNPIMAENMRLMHDNARPHVARYTTALLDSKNVRLLRQPPYSPDVNLLDNYVFKRLESRRNDFVDIGELRQFLNDELPNFTAVRMDKALTESIATMHKIVEAEGCYV